MTLGIIAHRIFILWYVLKDRWRDFLFEIKNFFQSILLFIQEKSTFEILLYFGLIIFLVWLSLYSYEYLKRKIKKKILNQTISAILELKFLLPVGGFFISIFLNNYIIFLYSVIIVIIIAVIEVFFIIKKIINKCVRSESVLA